MIKFTKKELKWIGEQLKLWLESCENGEIDKEFYENILEDVRSVSKNLNKVNVDEKIHKALEDVLYDIMFGWIFLRGMYLEEVEEIFKDDEMFVGLYKKLYCSDK